MKAIGYKVPGPIAADAALVDINLPRPVAAGYDILVEVKAVSVNPVDYKVRNSTPPADGDWKVLGWDAAGIVREVGPDVTQFELGDEVYYAGSITRPGTNAEFHLVDARIVGHKPASLSWAEAAALPLTTLTAWEAMAGALGKLREQLEASPTQFGKGVDYVLHAILHRVVDQYLPIFEMIEDDVLAMERRSLHDFLGPEEVARIFELRSELTRFQRTLGAMAELVRKLVRGHFPCISAEMTPYFHDVADHVHRVQSMVDGLLLVLSTVFEASSLLEAQRIGVVTRQLAAWAAILTVPTAIAGIYGMNFKHMPELDTPYGYFVVLGVIAVFCLLLFVRFKKAKWL